MSDVVNKVHLADHRPKVSIIIPVYNTEKYLVRCLDSVVGQTERDLEIICINDGSTDGSAAILEMYAEKDSRVRVITQENGGLSAARNSGLDVATGKYVMFVDSDDWIPADAAAKMFHVAEESGLPVVVSNGCAKDVLPRARATRCRWKVQRPALARFIANRQVHSSVCNKLYHRKTIGKKRFIAGIYFEDWPFNTELFADLPGFALIDEPMYVYTTGGKSITRSNFSIKKSESYLTGIAHVTAFFRRRPDATVAARRIAVAVKMLVGKALKCGDMELMNLIAAQDFSVYPLGLKTRFRLWKMKRRLTSGNGSIKKSIRLRMIGPEVLNAVHHALTPAGIRYWVDFGTLLGIVRDNNFIAHDTDIDFGVEGTTSPSQLYTLLRQADFRFVHGFTFEGRICELTFNYKGVPMDFFWDFTNGDSKWYYVCGCFDRKVRRHRHEKQVLRCYRIPIRGVEVCTLFNGTATTQIPTNTEELLEHYYGSGWRVPDPTWTSANDGRQRTLESSFAIKFKKFRGQ